MSATEASFTSESPNNILVESGAIALAQACATLVHVRRGMAMRSSEGSVVGHVAALLVDGESQKLTHLVLSHPRQVPEYRLVPITLICAVADEEISLSVCSSVAEGLPCWHAS